MALNGADLLIYPTAIGWDETEPESVYPSQLDAWQTIMRSHSIANGLHTIAVNRVGKEGHLSFWGNSFCANPFGKLLAIDNSQKSTLTTVTIDLKEKAEARKIWPFFRDRRVDKYQDLLKVWGE